MLVFKCNILSVKLAPWKRIEWNKKKEAPRWGANIKKIFIKNNRFTRFTVVDLSCYLLQKYQAEQNQKVFSLFNLSILDDKSLGIKFQQQTFKRLLNENG